MAEDGAASLGSRLAALREQKRARGKSAKISTEFIQPERGISGGGGGRDSRDDEKAGRDRKSVQKDDHQQQERQQHPLRERKNAPIEVSSKKRVRYVGREATSAKVGTVGSDGKRVDPRFVEYTGHLSEKHIRNVYGFVEEMREKEVAELREKARKTRNREKRDEILKDVAKREAEDARRREKANEVKVREEIWEREKEKIREGKTPYFPKKSEIRRLQLVEKYERLKAKGKLQKYIEKRRKSRASKDRKLLPARPSEE